MWLKQRVLCVDDDPDTCDLVSKILDESEVICELKFPEGVRRAAGEEFDIILLDQKLLDGTGLELCSQIRLFDVGTPILIVTAFHEITHEQALAAGAQGVIRKDHLSQVLPAAVAHANELRFHIFGASPP
jgi:DNA-binding response OmpR family regulator